PYDPPRQGRSTALLIAVALVVALGAGGSVYALMSGGGDDRADGDPMPTPTASASRSPDGSAPTVDADRPTRDGTIPTAYLGTWATTIDNASGLHTRTLTIRQGEVGDTVLSLAADGPAGNGTYHCVFEADLTDTPGPDGPVTVGPSTVTTGPSTTCTPGAPTEVALLPNGALQRTNTKTGEILTYTRQ
ncbi:serine/threonine protein kinase, partial [Streptomyces sp. WAC 04229]